MKWPRDYLLCRWCFSVNAWVFVLLCGFAAHTQPRVSPSHDTQGAAVSPNLPPTALVYGTSTMRLYEFKSGSWGQRLVADSPYPAVWLPWNMWGRRTCGKYARFAGTKNPGASGQTWFKKGVLRVGVVGVGTCFFGKGCLLVPLGVIWSRP